MTETTHDSAASSAPPNDSPSAAPSAEERNWAAGCHLAAFTGLATGIGFVLGPLVVWLYKKDESHFVSDQGKEALNFQLTMLLAVIVSCMLIIVLIGIPMLILLGIFNFICIIIGAIKASEGVTYRYPFNLRLIK
jgi:uncharacterized protein